MGHGETTKGTPKLCALDSRNLADRGTGCAVVVYFFGGGGGENMKNGGVK